jgi:predicted ATPase/class 3 adenylate cyclase
LECPNCKTQNPEGAKYCHDCGTALQLTCRNCGTRLVPGAKFCFNCGTPTATTDDSSRSAHRPTTDQSSNPQSADPALTRLQQYIPKELLAKLEQARANHPASQVSGMAGERRVVTVLFCDVKGSTSLAEMLDPEEWAEIMNGAFKHLIEPVYRYEGTLARLMGDAILAFFGAPIGHEDDPQRAVLAGLDIVEGMKAYREQMKRERNMDLNVRIGINTGLVVVGEVGSDLRVEYTAMGDAVNMASRMEQTAEPGTVQISGNTYKSVSNLFEFKSLGDIEVKGKTEPVTAYQVLRPIEGAVPTRGIEGLQSPLVGRERELSALHTAVNDLLQGKGQIISVMGEAGLGKSRLIAELRASAIEAGDQGSGVRGQESTNPQSAIRNTGAALPNSTSRLRGRHEPTGRSRAYPQWYEGRSLSYETTTPYAPFIDMLDALFGLHAEDTDDLKYSKLKGKLDEVMPGRGDEIAPYLASLLGIELSGEDVERVRYLEPLALRGRVFYAVGTLVGALASTGPCVLVFEDLHWADPTSLELIESLLPITGSAPLMLLAIFRPQSQDPSWHFHEIASRDYAHSYTPVTLQPLDEGDSRQLVANLLEIEDLPEKVRTLILKKAEGNPFFVEEVIRSLLDAKLVVRVDEHWRAGYPLGAEIENIAVPDTLAGVITARLDRLDDESKYVAQTASVIGREFQYDVLGDVYEAPQAIDGALSNLQRRELVREKSRLPRRVYLFKHVLTQETAYASVLMSRRRELHLKVGECLERIEPERVNEIGRHFLEARQEARALPYLLEAGDHALRSGAREEAADYFGKAIEAVHKAEKAETLYDLWARRAYEGLGKAREFAMSVPGAMQVYNEMLQFGRQHSDAAMQVSALNKLSLIEAMMLGQFAEADKHLVEAEELARQSEEVPGLIELYTVRCNMCSAVADFSNASRYLTEAAQLGRKLDNIQATAYGLAHKSNTLVHMTEYDEAWETGLEGLKVAEEANNLERRADILTYTMPMYHLRNGHLAEAQQVAEEGYAIAAKIGATYPPMLGAFVLGYLTQAQGDYEAAMQWFERALEHARPVFDFVPFMTAIPLGGLGSVCLDISEKLADKVVKLHTQALEILRTPTGAPAGGSGWADLGFCALELGEVERAGEYFQNGLNSPSIQMYEQRPRMLAGAGLAALARNRPDDAAKLLKEARQYAEERCMKFIYPLINIAEAKVSAAGGDTEDALKHYKAAEELALEMGMRPDVLQARLGAAAVLAGCGQLAEAQDVRREAQSTIDEIAALFKNDEYRQMFLESAGEKLVVSG